jgi:hypothetical protein
MCDDARLEALTALAGETPAFGGQWLDSNSPWNPFHQPPGACAAPIEED